MLVKGAAAIIIGDPKQANGYSSVDEDPQSINLNTNCKYSMSTFSFKKIYNF